MSKYKINEKQILIAIISVAVLIRVLVALYLGNQVVEFPGIADQITYHTLSQRVLNGFGFTFDTPWWPATAPGEPTAHWSYIYTFYLVGFYKLFGVNPIVPRVFQAVVNGILQPLLLYQLTKNVFSPRPALIAAGWISAYVYLIYYTAALMTESWFITIVIAVFYLAVIISKNSVTWRQYFLLGFLTGLAILLRQVILLFIPFLFIWLLWNKRKTGYILTIKNLILSSFVILVMILPFTYYNYQRFEKFVLLNTNAGFAFFWANNPVYGTHFEGILPEEKGNYLELLPVELKGLDEASLDSALLARGLSFVTQNPRQYILLSISRIPVLFEFWPTKDSSLISNISRVSSFAIALPFILLGIYQSLKRIIRKKEIFLDSPVSLLLIFGLVYCGIHILSWSLVRYRLPVDALFLSFSGFALDTIIGKLLKK
jgi:4-amino-4-deoxy-L-arabinose transferase-like glycosyltransferase